MTTTTTSDKQLTTDVNLDRPDNNTNPLISFFSVFFRDK